MFFSVLADRRFRQLDDGFVSQAGFRSFARALPEERGRVGGLHFPAGSAAASETNVPSPWRR